MPLYGGGALYLIQVPVAPVPDDDVRLHEDIVKGEGRLVDGLRAAVDLLARLRQLLVLRQPVEGHDHAPGEQHVGKITDLVPAFPERFELRRRRCPEFGLVSVKIQGFVALESPHVERLAQVGGLVRRRHHPLHRPEWERAFPCPSRIFVISSLSNLGRSLIRPSLMLFTPCSFPVILPMIAAGTPASSRERAIFPLSDGSAMMRRLPEAIKPRGSRP